MNKAFTSDYLFDGQNLIRDGVVEFDESGTVTHVGTEEQFTGKKPEKMSGILCPGFVNCHTHLELSHLAGKIPRGTGLTGFVKHVIKEKGGGDLKVMEKAELMMIQEGIVAAGDIANSRGSLPLKTAGKIHYHTFIEIYDAVSSAGEAFQEGIMLEEEFIRNGAKASITLHSPYTCSAELMKKAADYARKKNKMISIHMEESEDESLLFRNGGGKWKDFLSKRPIPTGESALASTAALLKGADVMFVHNTYAEEADVRGAMDLLDPWWCFCPNANLYIESRLPDFSMFHRLGAKCCIGTDSLASNSALSILSEMKTIATAAPGIPLETLLGWATSNGAKALGMDQRYGSLKTGMKPGLVLVEGADGGRITQGTSVRVVVKAG